MVTLRSLRLLIAAALVSLSLSGCWLNNGTESLTPTPPPGSVSEVSNELVRASITAAGGGTLTVPSGSSALAGAVVTIPADGPLADIEVQVGYEDAAPGPFRAEAVSAGAVAVSKTLDIKVASAGPSTFNRLLTITIPYDVAAAGTLPPAVVFWDAAAARYRSVAVTQVDRTAGTVTFKTSHL